MKLKKLKLNRMDIAPLSEKDLNNVLGGFFVASTGGGTASTGDSVSASTCKGADVDVTSDSDAETD